MSIHSPRKTQIKLAIELLETKKRVSTLEFRALGIMSPARVIERIKQRGGIVATSLESQKDSMGIVHERVAVYRLEGWIND